MLTAYDYPTGLACSNHGIDITLVGDSLAQVCLGYPSTTQLTLDEMVHHARAVARGTTSPFLVADMPFGSYQVSSEDALRNAVRLVRDAHVEAVKMEGGRELVDTVRRLTRMGIPVMAHVGLLPQRHSALSGYRVQGRDADAAREVLHSALMLQDAGAFSIVLEAIPHQLGSYITSKLSIPTIGIGAGPGTSGQVLVWDDVMGTWSGHKAKFVRRFADIKAERERGVNAYSEAVRDGSFPRIQEESYNMDKAEYEALLISEGDIPARDRVDHQQRASATA
jgi:3-methyl-2-oxobutanoate hydroxymethyltransferase